MQATDNKPKTVNLTINGKPVEVPAGTNVIDAADKAGVFIPRYCYHQDLSIAGVCRMCVVDVEKNPRLQISCNTACSEGMVVNTNTPKVKEAVKSALELHLINHPLDCPICDKAGECKLQDFYQDFGQYKSRMDWDNKVHKPKVVDIGTIVLDEERCILCTRCVRFTAEVTKTHELGIFNRGNRSELKTYDGGPLKNDYTGNLADICPVGALTAKDFRFKQRVWFMDKFQTVCGLCSRGCNITASVNPHTKKMFRVEPRRNVEVNKSWICDTGRWGYHHLYSEKRVKTPLLRLEGKLVETPWHAAFQKMKADLESAPQEIGVVLSTQMVCEEIVDLAQTLTQAGVKNITWLVDESVVDDRKPVDGILKHADLTPNAAGFVAALKLAGVAWVKQKEFLLTAKSLKRVWVFGVEGEEIPWVTAFLEKLPSSAELVIHSTSQFAGMEKAGLVLANVTAYERGGTWINALGRLQRVTRVLPNQHTARDGHAVAFGLERGDDRQSLPADRGENIYRNLLASRWTSAPSARWKQMDPMGTALSPEVLA